MRKMFVGLAAMLLLTGCVRVQPILVITLSELITLAVIYLFLCTLMASYLSSDTKKQPVFWLIWFFCVILSPVALVLTIIKACRS